MGLLCCFSSTGKQPPEKPPQRWNENSHGHPAITESKPQMKRDVDVEPVVPEQVEVQLSPVDTSAPPFFPHSRISATQPSLSEIYDTFFVDGT